MHGSRTDLQAFPWLKAPGPVIPAGARARSSVPAMRQRITYLAMVCSRMRSVPC